MQIINDKVKRNIFMISQYTYDFEIYMNLMVYCIFYVCYVYCI